MEEEAEERSNLAFFFGLVVVVVDEMGPLKALRSPRVTLPTLSVSE